MNTSSGLAGAASRRATATLPVRIAPRAGQSLDSYLEHLGAANGLSTAQLSTVLGRDGASMRYLSLAPDPHLLTEVATIAHLHPHDLNGTVLADYPAAAINSASVSNAGRYGHRAVAARGWVQLHGSQACPRCLAQNGVWKTLWRLPINTTCALHGRHLAVLCPRCHRTLRDGRHNHLRVTGADNICGNPLGDGPLRQCQQDLRAIATSTADRASIQRQARTDLALSGHPVQVLGTTVDGCTYLNDLRQVCILLLHLANQPDGKDLATWATGVQLEAKTRTKDRGPRWTIRPPTDPIVRAAALTEADTILSAKNTQVATDLLQPWFTLIPATNDGPLGWLRDRTNTTPTISRLITGALAPHRRISHHLDAHTPVALRRHIPQVLPTELYERHLAGLIASRPLTVRLYACLCLARTLTGVSTWNEAAKALRIPGEIGRSTARACSSKMLVDTPTFTRQLHKAAHDLTRVDYRTLEDTVRHRTDTTRWFDDWVRANRLQTPTSQRAHALTWCWLHVAHAHPDTAPPSGQALSTTARAARYRLFADALSLPDQAALIRTFNEKG